MRKANWPLLQGLSICKNTSNLVDNKNFDDTDSLVEMVMPSLEILFVDIDELDEMKENANWLMKLNCPKLRALCTR